MYLMSASLATMSARTPVSSRTSRSAVSSGFSPGSMEPFGKAMSSASAGVRFTFLILMFFLGRSKWGSMTARYQRPRIFRSTAPPAEVSRSIEQRRREPASFADSHEPDNHPWDSSAVSELGHHWHSRTPAGMQARAVSQGPTLTGLFFGEDVPERESDGGVRDVVVCFGGAVRREADG